MGEVHNYLPRLTVNELLIRDLIAEQTPCFAMGYVEDRKEKCGFIALRPEEPIPYQVTRQGMNFGHSVLGTDQYKFVWVNVFELPIRMGDELIEASIAMLRVIAGPISYFFIRPSQLISQSPFCKILVIPLLHVCHLF